MTEQFPWEWHKWPDEKPRNFSDVVVCRKKKGTTYYHACVYEDDSLGGFMQSNEECSWCERIEDVEKWAYIQMEEEPLPDVDCVLQALKYCIEVKFEICSCENNGCNIQLLKDAAKLIESMKNARSYDGLKSVYIVCEENRPIAVFASKERAEKFCDRHKNSLLSVVERGVIYTEMEG